MHVPIILQMNFEKLKLKAEIKLNTYLHKNFALMSS